MPSFTPPTVDDLPPYIKGSNESPWKYMRSITRGKNVWKLADGTYTENQPDPISQTDPGYVKIYLGAHTYTVDAAEAAALTAAGYTVT